MASPKTITLLLGGARSGKSGYAQKLASRLERVAFVATALPSDDDMRQKIVRHRADRPSSWTTFEEPVAIDRVLRDQAQNFDLILIDCLTIYTANLMAAEQEDSEAVLSRVDRLCEVLREFPTSVVLVSNEAGSGVVPASRIGCLFRDLIGEVNQRVARVADDVLLLVAGLPLALKGRIEGSP